MCDLLLYIILFAGIYGAYKYVQKWMLEKKLERFSKEKCPKDVVILHGTPRIRTIPAASPFVLKLETFLRMAKIKYEYDGNIKNTFGPKGKTPWLSLNGEHVADSQVCIEFLTKKFDVQIKNNYDEKQNAVAKLVRVMLEERIFWEIVLWGFVWGGPGHAAVKRFLKLPGLFLKYMSYMYGKMAWSQGLGRHTPEVVTAWTLDDMKTIANILGNNKFLLGDEPCVEDCAAFGFFAQMIWGFPSESQFAEVTKRDYPQLEAYCLRMKELYYPDWDQLLARRKGSS